MIVKNQERGFYVSAKGRYCLGDGGAVGTEAQRSQSSEAEADTE